MIDTSKIIHAPINGSKYTETAPLWKEHYGIYLKIEGADLPETYEVDFSNDELHGTSVTMIGNADGVLIPHQFIDTGKDVFAFLYWVGEDFGKTVYKIKIPNRFRPDRTNEQPTPEEQSVIDQAIAALNGAVEQTAQDVIDADASAQESAESARASANSAVQASLSESNAERAKGNAQASAESASASATASAQSASEAETARQATTSLVAEAQRYANASEQSATASANSAEQAESAKGVAQSYAQDAQTSATYASLSESTASTKASEASGYASTASQKATEASQSASQASGYAQTAESAKTASQTAQGKAEDAQTAAETAQGLAEDAQEAAESAAASVSASAAQIATNTADIASLEADILKAFPTDSASGAIASFSDGAEDIPLKSLVVDINPVQDLSNGDPSPDNICPISGWTGANLNKTGKNLFDATLLKDQAAWNIIEISVKPSTVYTMSTDKTRSGLYLYFKNMRTGGGVNSDVVNSTHPVTITSTEDGKVYVSQRQASGDDSFQNYHYQIELGTSATAYEPYKTPTLIPISWQTEAGTVYGGKLDVLSGALSIFNKHITITDADSFENYGTTGFTFNPNDMKSGMAQNGLCNLAPTVSRVSSYGVLFGSNNSVIYFAQAKSVWGVTTIADAKQWAIDHGLELVYPLAEPIEIQLTPHEVSSLLGQNNIWADTGDTSVEYRADTKLYIEKLTQPEEDDMIADSNIVSGQYFMVGNNLYKATANIASGSAVVVGTNATRKSLAQALNEINA